VTEAMIIIIAAYAIGGLLAWRFCRVTSIVEQREIAPPPVVFDEEHVMSDEELAEFAAQVRRNVERNRRIREAEAAIERTAAKLLDIDLDPL
jgi:hypothetical protein